MAIALGLELGLQYPNLMTAVLESPPPTPAIVRPQVTREEMAATEKWLAKQLRPFPDSVVPRITPGQALTLIKTGQDDRLKAIIEKYNSKVVQMELDPIRHGFEPDCWKDADKCVEEAILTCVFGGGGSSKSRWAARTGVRKLCEKAGAKVLWLHEAQQPSIIVQQAFVYDYLPYEFRHMKIRKYDRTTKINYSKGTGFLAGQHHLFVLPNGSMGVFGFYNQDIKVCESHGWDLVLADENLPLGWLKTLLYRLPRCNGKMAWTFSPIYGITPAIKEVVAGAKVTKSLPAEMMDQKKIHVPGCPVGHMPYLQYSSYVDAKIIYFFTEMNPWSGYPMQKQLALKKNATVEDVERRFYGWSRDTVGRQFPKFGEWNIVKKVPEDMTRYLFKDPGPGRNAFFIWVGVDRYGRHWVYREWPDVPTYGEWAVASDNAKKFDGDPGPAQITLGKGVRGYKEIILKAEGNTWTGKEWDSTKAEKIFMRYGDPRAMASPSGVEEGCEGSTMFDRYLEEQLPPDKEEASGPPMDFLPAPGYHVERGVEMINDLLDTYNPNEPVTALLNEPKLYVHESCKNVIWSMLNWTWRDGEKGASKDPIDCLRYMATADLTYQDPTQTVSYGGGSY